MPSRNDPNYISPYRVSDTVFHQKFGRGKVTDVDRAKLTIEFPVGTKRVIDAFVELIPERPDELPLVNLEDDT